ncbi:MAG: arsenate reductase (azurin) small subunit [Alteromonadaceae bacterium]|nr:MAG: arsenate reductase (azurin) small subunit [Alteromonadaceae bacterium]
MSAQLKNSNLEDSIIHTSADQPEPSRADLALNRCHLSRREFLWAGALSVTATAISLSFGRAFAGSTGEQTIQAEIAEYPRLAVCKLSELKNDEPLYFNYPDNEQNSNCMLVKLGTPAGGGMGAERDIVAYSALCTHQGMPLVGAYRAKEKALGACPAHLSTYDLTRHGIIISGQAYQNLPQVLLEQEGDTVYAVGLLGLLFGRNNNFNHAKPYSGTGV